MSTKLGPRRSMSLVMGTSVCLIAFIMILAVPGSGATGKGTVFRRSTSFDSSLQGASSPGR